MGVDVSKAFTTFVVCMMAFGGVLAIVPNISDEADAASGSSGTCTWSLNESTGVLTVTGSGNIPSYFGGTTNTNNPLYAYKDRITSVVIEEGITSVGDSAFLSCIPNATSLSLPSTLTHIGYRAFEGGGMTSVYIPDSVTGYGARAFYQCTNLSSVRLSESTTSLSDSMFGYCASLKTVTLPDSLTTVDGYAFVNSGIESINIPVNVTSLGDRVFFYCDSLHTVKFACASAPTIGKWAFYLHEDSSVPAVNVYTNGGWGSDSVFTTNVKGSYVSFNYHELLYEYEAILNFDANGGTTAPSSQTAVIQAVTPSGSYVFTIPSGTPTRAYYEFLGWSTSKTATTASYQPNGNISVDYGSEVTLYAVWKVMVPTIVSSPNTLGIVGDSWSYDIQNEIPSGVTYSVTGASWLTVSGNKLIGTPTTSGTYHVTVYASYGSQSYSQSFDIVIVERLSFESIPTGSILVTPA